MKKRRLLVAAVALSLVVNQALAFWGLLAPISTGVMWLGRVASSNVTMARAVEWSLLAHGAVISFFAWKNASDTSAETRAPVKARLVVQPNTTAQRDNPDSSTWDSAASGQRNPTPKTSYSVIGTNDYPSGQQQFTTIAQNAFQQPYDTYSVSSGQVYKKTYQCMPTNTRPDSSLTNGSLTWSTEGTSTVNGAVVFCFSKPTEKVTISCPAGYTTTATGSNFTCTLSVDPTTVQKPRGKVPCEVLQNADGTWDIDSQNPECASVSSALTKSNSGKTVSYSRGDGTYDQITTNADGSRTVTTGNRTINLSPAGADGNSTITGISDAGINSGSGSSGSGSGSSTGSGTGSCGGSGQPACSVSVDDSSFNGKDVGIATAADDAKSKFDERQALVESQGKDTANFGLDSAWIPSLVPGPAVTCEALSWQPVISHGVLSGLAGSIDIDWCSKIDIFREFFAWLIGLLTVWAIAMLFFSSNGNTGRTGK